MSWGEGKNWGKGEERENLFLQCPFPAHQPPI